MNKLIFFLLLVCSISFAEERMLKLENDHSHHAHHNEAHKLNPIGVMGAHTHAEGEWMFSYRFKYMDMEGLRDGESRVSHQDHVGNPMRNPGRFMVLPRRMRMKMHMLGAMYGVTDNLTIGVMLPWVEKDMSHKIANGRHFNTRTDGIGDIKINSFYKIYENESFEVILQLGVSLPTGEIDEEGNTPAAPNGVRLPYPMQLGSGTYDIMPGIALVGHNDSWGYGLQAVGTFRVHRNHEGYNQGDSLLVNAWVSRKITKNFSTSFRLELNSWEDYEGHDDIIHNSRLMVPTADNDRRAGTRLDAHLGFNYLFTDGFLCGHSIGLEAGMPIYQNIEGPNLETDFIVTIGWQYRF